MTSFKTQHRLSSCVAVAGVLAAGASQPASGQDASIPRVELSTRADLVQVLRGDPDVEQSGIRFALLAAQGREIVPRLHAILTDETEDGIVRVNALRVLGFVLDSSSVRIVLQYASRPGPFRVWAHATLQRFPYAEACEYWRSVLRDPSLHNSSTTHYALSGIRFCGNEADQAIVEAYVARGVSRGTRETADFVISRLRMPVVDRYRNTDVEGNYPPTGDYKPPPALAARIRQQLCGGPCAAGLVVQASAVTKLRGY
jgi:hypothetical protein